MTRRQDYLHGLVPGKRFVEQRVFKVALGYDANTMAIKAPLLVSLNIGRPRDYGTPGSADPMDEPFRSAIAKQPVEGRVRLARGGLDGDGKAEKEEEVAGDTAVLAYPADHYPLWREELGRRDFGHGAFGENFTLTCLDEKMACIGDVFRIGEAIVQVTMPREACSKLSRRWRIRDLDRRAHETVRVGWFFRVLKEGFVERGNLALLEDRPFPRWTIEAAYRLAFHPGDDPVAAADLSACPMLAARWKEKLH